MQTIIARNIKDLKKILMSINKNQKVGLIPTMGCLHDGHLALIRKSKKLNLFTVVSIFLNPLQFNNKKDLKRYPFQEKEDISLLKKNKVNLVFIPKLDEIYPNGYSTNLNENLLSNILCGKYRERHFSGVTTIVLKLFLLVKPDIAFFGEKDFQQLLIIKKIVKDLNLEIEILSVSTVRDKYGLALSSRNQLLKENDLKVARQIYRKLKLSDGKKYKYTKSLVKYLRKELNKSGIQNIEYIEIRYSSNLLKPNKLNSKKDTRVFVAVKFDEIRLIDNYKLQIT